MQSVWVFNGEKAQFPSGVFSTQENAEAWIAAQGLSGTLTQYPMDVGVYDWAVQKGSFKPKRDDQRSAEFIAQFSSALQVHFHYRNGSKA
jgi:hypothetical protein